MTMPARVGAAKVARSVPGAPDPAAEEPAEPKVRNRIRCNRIVPDDADPRRRHSVVDPDGRPVPAQALEAQRRRLRNADDTRWLDGDEWPKVKAALVCETPSCPARGREVIAWLAENGDGVYRASCAGCGRDITGLYETDDDDPDPE